MAAKVSARKPGEHRSSEESRRKILDSALELAHERGFHGTTMALISKHSGMPAGSLYWHFDSKDNLFSALLERENQKREEETGGWDPTAGDTMREHLTKFVNERTGVLNPENGFWRIGLILSLERSLGSPDARAQFLSIRNDLNSKISNWWSQMLGEATVAMDPGLPQRLTTFLIAAVDGFVISETAGEDWNTEDLGRTLVDSLIPIATQAMGKAGVSEKTVLEEIVRQAPAMPAR